MGRQGLVIEGSRGVAPTDSRLRWPGILEKEDLNGRMGASGALPDMRGNDHRGGKLADGSVPSMRRDRDAHERRARLRLRVGLIIPAQSAPGRSDEPYSPLPRDKSARGYLEKGGATLPSPPNSSDD